MFTEQQIETILQFYEENKSIIRTKAKRNQKKKAKLLADLKTKLDTYKSGK